MTFDEVLREEMKRAGFDVEVHGDTERFRRHLADRYGIDLSPARLSHYVTGKRTPRPATLIGLLDAFDIHGEQRDQIMRIAFPPEKDFPPEKGDEAAA